MQLNFEACFRIKGVSKSFLTTNHFLEKYSSNHKSSKDKQVDQAFTKPIKENVFMEIILSLKYSRKCNKFWFMWDSIWMTDVTDGSGLKWCINLDKLFVLINFSLLHKIGSCSILYFLCCYVKYLMNMKTKGLCIMPTWILEANFVRKLRTWLIRGIYVL